MSSSCLKGFEKSFTMTSDGLTVSTHKRGAVNFLICQNKKIF